MTDDLESKVMALILPLIVATEPSYGDVRTVAQSIIREVRRG